MRRTADAGQGRKPQEYADISRFSDDVIRQWDKQKIQQLIGGAISFCRQIVFVFPFAFIFAGIAKSDSNLSWLSWTTFPVAELLTSVVGVFLFWRIWNKNKK